MSLYSLSIRRPVLALVMSLAIILFGVIGFFYLGVREYPAVDPPIITVSTSYPGANADVIESQITEPLEESVNGIAGIRTQTLALPPAASQRSIWYASDLPLVEKRMSSPPGFAWLKSKKSLFSRTSNGKFFSNADAGKSAPSGVVMMYIEPECFQSSY